jgi:hypothetical protein
MKEKPIQNKLSPATNAYLKQINTIWRWTGNAYQWAGWLRRQGIQEDAIIHLANRIAQGKIKNPFSLQEVAYIISQNAAEQKHAAAAKEKALRREAAPEMLSAIFKRAGM